MNVIHRSGRREVSGARINKSDAAVEDSSAALVVRGCSVSPREHTIPTTVNREVAVYIVASRLG